MEKVKDVVGNIIIEFYLRPMLESLATCVIFGAFGYAYCSSYRGAHHENFFKMIADKQNRKALRAEKRNKSKKFWQFKKNNKKLPEKKEVVEQLKKEHEEIIKAKVPVNEEEPKIQDVENDQEHRESIESSELIIE